MAASSCPACCLRRQWRSLKVSRVLAAAAAVTVARGQSIAPALPCRRNWVSGRLQMLSQGIATQARIWQVVCRYYAQHSGITVARTSDELPMRRLPGRLYAQHFQQRKVCTAAAHSVLSVEKVEDVIPCNL